MNSYSPSESHSRTFVMILLFHQITVFARLWFMIFKRKQTPESLIIKGDKYFNSKKFKKALDSYTRANELDPDNQKVYDKMIAAHLELKDDWNDEDLAISLTWTMKKQELENPALKRIHARMTPEWESINGLVKQLLLAKDENEETRLIGQITNHGEAALYPLLEFVLGIKKVTPGVSP